MVDFCFSTVVCGIVGVFVVVRILCWIVELLAGPPTFKNKVVWITGGSSGIGENLAYGFSAAGATVILSARRKDELERVKNACKHPEKVIVYPMDMSEPHHTEKAARQFLAENPTLNIDILINNAGMGNHLPFLEDTIKNDMRIFNLNVLSQIAITRPVAEKMKAQKSGQIVVISSIAGKLGVPYRSSYSGSKHAVIALFDSLRAELQSEGIHVTVLCPGYIRTNFDKNVITGKNGELSGKTSDNIANGMAPEVFTKKALKAIFKKQKEVIIPDKFEQRLGVLLRTLVPDVMFHILGNKVRKENERIMEIMKKDN